MIFPGSVALRLRFVRPVPLAPFADKFPQKQPDNHDSSNSQQIRVGFSEHGLDKSTYSPVFYQSIAYAAPSSA
jgi:hypothetical protein